VNHFDPFHRATTKAWLDQIAVLEPTAPAFVANEWTAPTFEFARDHRNEFRNRLGNDFPMLDAQSLETLTRSLAYEGDVFDEAFGHDRALWLGHVTDVATLIDFRVARCHQFVDKQGQPNDGDAFLRFLSAGAHACAQPPGPGDDRDGQLAAAIHTAAVEHDAIWAIAILGANHAYRMDSTAVDLLDTEHDCRVRIMLANSTYVDP
jgi:hypothetical protein